MTDLAAELPGIDGSFMAGTTGYILRGLFASYPELEQPIRESLTPRGLQMLDWSGHTCIMQTGIDYAFRHLQFWFNDDITHLAQLEPFKTLLAAQRVGNTKPTGPVYIAINRFDPLNDYNAARQSGLDYCAMNADVTFWTNEQPPLFNKLAINTFLPVFVDGERSMAWVTDRFNGVTTSPNCGHF